MRSLVRDERLSLKIWVDNVKKRVVLAEAGCDFVDVLFSFVSLSLGTIVKLLSKNSGLGSIDNLYDSIEKLDNQDCLTNACRNMILSSRNVALNPYELLMLNADGVAEWNKLCCCKKENCISGSKHFYSIIRGTRCYYCGEIMDEVRPEEKVKIIKGDGVFVKRNVTKFIITDDFHVKASSLLHYCDILKEFDIDDMDLMEEWTLKFGKKEFLNLLKKLLEGKKVLTKICFPDLCIQSTTDEMKLINFESKGNEQLKTEKLHIKLFMNKINNNVVCAEFGDEFANQLFSFLIFPLGLVLKFIGNSNSLGCMPNLYNSIQELNINCFKSEEAKNILISPQPSHFFGYNKQILYIKEDSPEVVEPTHECKMDNKNVPCFEEINPKLAKKDQNLDGRFIREDQIFLIADDLHIAPMSVISFHQILKKHGLKVDHVEKREMTIGMAEVCALLEAMLISKTALNDALLPYIRQVGDME